MISKQSLIAYGERKSAECSEWFYYEGFTDCAELMWPLVEKLAVISDHLYDETHLAKREIARQALSDLEKRIGAE